MSSFSQGTAKKAIGRDWKRRYPRYRTDLPLRVTMLQESGYQDIHGRCGDIGEGGLGAVLTAEVPKGEVVDLEVEHPDGTVLAARAIVRFRKGLFHGFEFLALAPEQRTTIDALCQGQAILP